jgi:hypothetical protein
MDWNRVEGNWKQAKGKVKEKWGQLTDDDLTQVNGQTRTPRLVRADRTSRRADATRAAGRYRT